MKQLEFESLHSAFWHDIEQYLNAPKKGKQKDTPYNESEYPTSRFPEDYRRLCQHLAVAKSRRYSSSLVAQLNRLVQRGYEVLYAHSGRNSGGIIEFLIYGFPAALRANSNYLWLAAAVFVLPFALMMMAVMLNDQLIYSLMGASDVRAMESMYDPSLRKLGRERQSDSDILMFGYYIYNNIGIAFKCFATGLFVAVGSIFVMAFNGLYIGAITGHLTALGFTSTFYSFVIGHGSFELTAIVFSGAAGLKLGFAILVPGQFSRIKSLQNAAKDAIKIMYGVFIMLMIAAFIEAFWSSSTLMPNAVKYSVGAALWVFVFYYCFFFARKRVAAYRYATQ